MNKSVSASLLAMPFVLLFGGCELLDLVNKFEEEVGDFADPGHVEEMTSTEPAEDFDPADGKAEVRNCGEACWRIDECHGFGEDETFGASLDECLEGCVSVREEIAATEAAEPDPGGHAGHDGEGHDTHDPGHPDDGAHILHEMLSCLEHAGCDAEAIHSCGDVGVESASHDEHDHDETHAADENDDREDH